MNKEEIRCDYRSIGSYLIIAILVPFVSFMIYASVRFKGAFLWGITVIMFLILLYYVMQMLNRRVELTEEYIVQYNIFGNSKQYDLCDITQITIRTEHRDGYVLVKKGMKKIKVNRMARNYDDFERRICKLFNLKGYSNSGTHTYNV